MTTEPEPEPETETEEEEEDDDDEGSDQGSFMVDLCSSGNGGGYSSLREKKKVWGGQGRGLRERGL